MRKNKLLISALAGTMCLGLCLTGCGSNAGSGASKSDIQKNGIEMGNYIVISTSGQDKCGVIDFELNKDALIEDCVDFLIDDSEDGVDELKQYVDENIDIEDIVYVEIEGPLSNGDELSVYVEGKWQLGELLTVDVVDTEMTYTVKDLDDFEPVDPFEYVDLVYVNAPIYDEISSYGRAAIFLPEGGHTEIGLTVYSEEGQKWKNGDTIHVSVSEDTLSRFEEKYGFNIFSRTETDIKIDKMIYMPTTEETARETLKVMEKDEVCLENARYSIEEIMEDHTETDVNVELIGTMLYYHEDGHERSNDRDFYNQIVFVYKMTNDIHPDGWYSYMAYNGEINVAHTLNKGTLEWEKTISSWSSHLLDDFRYYTCEDTRFCYGEFPMAFEYDGKQYPGHIVLEDVFKALEQNGLKGKEYEHLVVSDSLKDYVTEK